MNLFRPPFQKGEFDVILCNGVLHHTSDPRGGFMGLVPLLKPGGHIVIGLYNKYGRLATDFRRGLFHVVKGSAKFIDPYLRSVKMSRDKERAWFADQYLHPHESKHTIDEVLGWFDQAGLEFVNGVPPVDQSSSQNGLFTPSRPGSSWEHFSVQAKQIVTGSREGGFFVMIARRPEE
jgi:SAM-dependent methyltransferase